MSLDGLLGNIDFDAIADRALDSALVKAGLQASATTSTSPTKGRSNMPDLKVTPEAIRAESVNVMRLHPDMNVEDATALAERLLRVQHNEPAITTHDQWTRATLKEQSDHLRNGWDVPLSPLEIMTSDPDRFLAEFPDHPDAITMREAARWESLTDAQKADETAATALLSNLRKTRADMLDAAGRDGASYVPDLQVMVSTSGASDGVKRAAEVVFKREKAATEAKAAEPTIADLMRQADADLAAYARENGLVKPEPEA